MSIEFSWPIKVYYEDTDAGGVVYYANYLKFFERARSEWLNALGLDQAALLDENIAFAVKKAEVEYLKPAKLNDNCLVISTISERRAASLTFNQALVKADDINCKLSVATINVVCLKLDSFMPCRIPAIVNKELARVS